jgi:dihydroorotase
MSQASTRLTITRPDDWHLHLRDGDAMKSVLRHSATVFGRALVMPNLKPPVRQTCDALNYRRRILRALEGLGITSEQFQPLMTLYLTDDTTIADIAFAAASEHIYAAKLYPANATTNSAAGVSHIQSLRPVFEAMQKNRLVLSVHGEALRDNQGNIDIFDREMRFLDTLSWITDAFPDLRIVLEHVTTCQAVDFVLAAGQNVAATITAHHLLYNRNAIFEGGIRPHLYCLPVLKREEHRGALLRAATSGNPKFFLGTDSAPHAQNTKEASCGCAGCYTAHAALPLYAEAFAAVNALDSLEGFASHFGADFYGLPRNQDTVTLIQEPWIVPAAYPFGDKSVIPLRAGEPVLWRVVD